MLVVMMVAARHQTVVQQAVEHRNEVGCDELGAQIVQDQQVGGGGSAQQSVGITGGVKAGASILPKKSGLDT